MHSRTDVCGQRKMAALKKVQFKHDLKWVLSTKLYRLILCAENSGECSPILYVLSSLLLLLLLLCVDVDAG